MGKLEEAVRDEVLRVVRKEIRDQLLPLEKEVRELRRALGQAQRPAAKPETRPSAAPATNLDLSAPAEEVERARINGDVIRSLRRRLGISQSQLAAIIGVTPGAVAQWELNSISPRGRNREALVALRRAARRDVQAAWQAVVSGQRTE